MKWFSKRFDKYISVTQHAVDRMRERSVTRAELKFLIELGKIHQKDGIRQWIYLKFPYRQDNMISATISLEGEVVVKTVMHNWTLVEV